MTPEQTPEAGSVAKLAEEAKFEAREATGCAYAENAAVHLIRMDAAIARLAALAEQSERLRQAITGYLPFLPATTAADGGASAHSAMVRASDGLKAALNPKD